MRFSRTAALVLATCALGLTACGSDDEESSAITTLPTVPTTTADPAATTATGPDGTATTPTTGAATGDDGVDPATETLSDGADADDSVPSGGVSPSGGSADAKGTAGGDQPTITPGTADEPASAIAADPTTVDLWCEQARQGAYDGQVGEATSLAITVRGSDDTRICELPR